MSQGMGGVRQAVLPQIDDGVSVEDSESIVGAVHVPGGAETEVAVWVDGAGDGGSSVGEVFG
jgi:hypothetical protein